MCVVEESKEEKEEMLKENVEPAFERDGTIRVWLMEKGERWVELKRGGSGEGTVEGTGAAANNSERDSEKKGTWLDGGTEKSVDHPSK